MKIGFALCGSFCTFEKAFEVMSDLKKDYDILPIMSENAYNTDTRFGTVEEIRKKAKEICGREIIHTITMAEPLGPKNMVDMLIIAPCTGNTVGKLAQGITDTSVTMAAKSCLRIGIPVVICMCSNDGLGASFMNVGKLLNTKNVYFNPLVQDDPIKKPNSLVADFSKIRETISLAFEKKQIQPLF